MNKDKKESHANKCNCDKPEIRESFKGNCSEEQIIKCHGSQKDNEEI